MPTVRGKAEVRAYFAAAPERLTKVLRGAARAGAKVVAEEIKRNTPSDEVRAAVRIRSQASDGQIRVKIDVKPGWARSLGIWLEYGTAPHLISVDESQRAGRSIGRINRLAKGDDSSHSLVIGGNFVGATVLHPGAQAHPTFRPAIDQKEAEAIAAAQAFINVSLSGPGIADDGAGDAE